MYFPSESKGFKRLINVFSKALQTYFLPNPCSLFFIDKFDRSDAKALDVSKNITELEDDV